MNRLDRVLGVAGWRDHYQTLGNGAVRCILSIRFGDDWISKQDVGGPSDQEDADDRIKAAFSSALKRTAVKFGVGRYLYSLPTVWESWDAERKCFANERKLGASLALRWDTR
jgi:hypothetical protein